LHGREFRERAAPDTNWKSWGQVKYKRQGNNENGTEEPGALTSERCCGGKEDVLRRDRLQYCQNEKSMA